MMIFKFTNGTNFQDEGFSPIQRARWVDIIRLIISLMTFTLSTFVLFSIIMSKKSRVKGFNLYLLLHLLSEICLGALVIFITASTLKSGFFPPSRPVCIFSSVVIHSYIFYNMWINVLISGEVFQMLRISSQRQRYDPTCSKKILIRALITFTASVVVGMYQSVNLSFSNVYIEWNKCVGTRDYDITVMNRIILSIVTVFIPIAILLYTSFTVYKDQLLPAKGKCRFITTFFLRIVIFTTTSSVLSAVAAIGKNENLFLIGSFLFLIQGFVVSTLSLQKYDLRKAALDIICNWSRNNEPC